MKLAGANSIQVIVTVKTDLKATKPRQLTCLDSGVKDQSEMNKILELFDQKGNHKLVKEIESAWSRNEFNRSLKEECVQKKIKNLLFKVFEPLTPSKNISFFFFLWGIMIDFRRAGTDEVLSSVKDQRSSQVTATSYNFNVQVVNF